MANLFERLFKGKATKEIVVSEKEKAEDHEDVAVKAGSTYAAMQSANQSVRKAAEKFAKPAQYDRSLYDSGAAKRNAKMQAFQSGKTVIDPYTGNELCLTKAEAKMRFGDDWKAHLAESDHNISLKQRYEDTKYNAWQTVDDIKRSSNSADNMTVTSSKFNNAKRSRSNEEFVEDKAYLGKTDIELEEPGRQEAIQRQKKAERVMMRSDFADSARNIIETGHTAGVDAAYGASATALTMSGINNIVAVINGEKDAEEAIIDTATATGRVALNAYAQGGGVTVVTHSLSSSSSSFLRALGENNVPTQIITAVTMTGDVIKRYAAGEISTQECILQLGERGVTVATTGYASMVGQALIPIPIVGAAVGAMVGSALTSTYYNQLVSVLRRKELEHQERLRIIAECEQATQEMREFREELERYLESYFRDYQNCFDEALNMIHTSFQFGDANGMIAGANQITRKLGGKVHYNNMDEFKDFLFDDSTDIL